MTMNGNPIGTSTRPEKIHSSRGRKDEKPTKTPTIHSEMSKSRAKASQKSPTPKKIDVRKPETPVGSSKRTKKLHKRRSVSSPTLKVKEEGSPSQVAIRPLPRINLDLLSVETPVVVERKPAHKGMPPRPWDLNKSPRGQAGLGVSHRGARDGSTLEELTTQAKSLESKVKESKALYVAWWDMYDLFARSKPTHEDVVAMHQRMKEAAELSGWEIHDELISAQVSLQAIEGRIDKLEKG